MFVVGVAGGFELEGAVFDVEVVVQAVAEGVEDLPAGTLLNKLGVPVAETTTTR